MYNKWKGKWEFYLTEGNPLTYEEIKLIKNGDQIGRDYQVFKYNNVILKQGRKRVNEALIGDISSLNEILLKYEQLGRDATVASETDTALLDPEPLTKKQISALRIMEDEGTPEYIEVVSYWTEGTTGLADTWKEYGLYTADGLLFLRVNIDLTVTGVNSLTIRGEIQQKLT